GLCAWIDEIAVMEAGRIAVLVERRRYSEVRPVEALVPCDCFFEGCFIRLTDSFQSLSLEEVIDRIRLGHADCGGVIGDCLFSISEQIFGISTSSICRKEPGIERYSLVSIGHGSR